MLRKETMDKKLSTKRLLQAAVIACIYAVLTIALAPISYGPMQVRLSEALTVLPALTPVGIPGLIIGCFVANLLGPYGVFDVVFGTLATSLAAVFSYGLRRHDWLVPLPPIIANGVLVGGMLHYAYGVPGLWACMAWVALGELIACYVVGLPLLKVLRRYDGIFR